MNAKHFTRLLCLAFLLTGAPALAVPRVKAIKLSVANPTDELRLHENIVLSVAELKRIAPDFKAGDIVVTTSDASTLAEDAQTLQTIELPSQADDLDGDNKYDEIAFQIELKPKQTRIVTIAYGETASRQEHPFVDRGPRDAPHDVNLHGSGHVPWRHGRVRSPCRAAYRQRERGEHTADAQEVNQPFCHMVHKLLPLLVVRRDAARRDRPDRVPAQTGMFARRWRSEFCRSNCREAGPCSRVRQ